MSYQNGANDGVFPEPKMGLMMGFPVTENGANVFSGSTTVRTDKSATQIITCDVWVATSHNFKLSLVRS